MPRDSQGTAHRNRLDHVLPRGYLDGFTNPSNQGQLSVFDLQRNLWFETGTAVVGAAKGFYDYTPGSVPDQTADEAFAELEGGFPAVRSRLVAGGFSAWVTQLDFLLKYAQMLRARSRLFREHALTQARQATILRVEEVPQQEPKPFVPGETLLRNMTITQMRMEIAKGSGLFAKLHWCLRLTSDFTDPVITAGRLFFVDSTAPMLDEALRDAGTLIFFPLCWQACLVGSPAKFDIETGGFHQPDLKGLQMRYLQSDCRFVYSPVRLEFQKADI